MHKIATDVALCALLQSIHATNISKSLLSTVHSHSNQLTPSIYSFSTELRTGVFPQRRKENPYSAVPHTLIVIAMYARRAHPCCTVQQSVRQFYAVFGSSFWCDLVFLSPYGIHCTFSRCDCWRQQLMQKKSIARLHKTDTHNAENRWEIYY